MFGLLGYILPKMGFAPAPLLLGFILGPLMEANLRRAMTMARGDPSGLVQEPISLAMLVTASLLLITTLLPTARLIRERTFAGQ